MQFQVKVQGTVVKSFESDNGYFLASVNNDVNSMIARGEITVDNSKPVLIEVVKVS